MKILESCFYSIKTHSRVLVYSQSTMLCKRGSLLNVKEQLQIGKKWNKADRGFTSFFVDKNSKVCIGNVKIFCGCRIVIKKNAVFEFKSGYLNSNCQINCKNKISIGSGCEVANNVVIRDNNSHSIDGSIDNKTVKIGDNVWICTNAIILPGAQIGNGCVVAAGSIVNKKFPNNCLIGGVPAKILKENINWKNFETERK